MATTNKNLEQPARGSNVGVWDTPVNDNMGIVDNSFGGTATIPLTNSNITLSAAQYQNVFLTFTGAISANIVITLPGVGSFYTVQNLTSNTSAFTLTMQTASGGPAIGLPPGEAVDVMSQSGSNGMRFRNLGRIGEIMDFIGSSVPSWVSACTIPPYLLCNGTTFSSATYPILATVLGGTTLPDARGRTRFNLNQGTGRLTAINGNTNLSAGGSETIGQVNLPSYNLNLGSLNVVMTNATQLITANTLEDNVESGAGASDDVPKNASFVTVSASIGGTLALGAAASAPPAKIAKTCV